MDVICNSRSGNCAGWPNQCWACTWQSAGCGNGKGRSYRTSDTRRNRNSAARGRRRRSKHDVCFQQLHELHQQNRKQRKRDNIFFGCSSSGEPAGSCCARPGRRSGSAASRPRPFPVERTGSHSRTIETTTAENAGSRGSAEGFRRNWRQGIDARGGRAILRQRSSCCCSSRCCCACSGD